MRTGPLASRRRALSSRGGAKCRSLERRCGGASQLVGLWLTVWGTDTRCKLARAEAVPPNVGVDRMGSAARRLLRPCSCVHRNQRKTPPSHTSPTQPHGRQRCLRTAVVRRQRPSTGEVHRGRVEGPLREEELGWPGMYRLGPVALGLRRILARVGRGLTPRSRRRPATAATVWPFQAIVGIVLARPAGVCLHGRLSSNVRRHVSAHSRLPPSRAALSPE
jgi:hypothetical protein